MRALVFLALALNAAAGVEDFFARLPPGAPPDEANRMFHAGLDLARQKQWAEALAFFEQAVRERPQHAEALHMAGICLWMMGDLPRAQRFLVLSSRHPEALPATSLALSAIHAGLTNRLESAGWMRKGLREAEEGEQMRWITHEFFAPLWDPLEPAFRSVLLEFGLPLNRDEAAAGARKAAPHMTDAYATPDGGQAETHQVFRVGMRLDGLPADPDERLSVIEEIKRTEAGRRLKLGNSIATNDPPSP